MQTYAGTFMQCHYAVTNFKVDKKQCVVLNLLSITNGKLQQMNGSTVSRIGSIEQSALTQSALRITKGISYKE